MLLINIVNSKPPGNPIVSVRTHVEDVSDAPKANCLDLEIGSSNNGIINLDCPDNAFYWAKIIKNNCGCEDFSLNINGVRVKQLSKDELKIFKLTKEDLKNVISRDKTGVSSFTIRVDCLNFNGYPSTSYALTSGYSTISVNVVKDGMEYDKQIARVPSSVLYEFIPTMFSDVPTICCNTASGIHITDTDSKITGSSISNTFKLELSGDLSIGLNPITTFTINNPITFSYQNVKFESSEQVKFNSKSLDLKGPEFGCLKVGYQVYGDVLILQKYKANCMGSDIPVGSPYEVAYPTGILYKCFPTAPLPSSACKAIRPLVEQRYSIVNRFSYSGTLDLELDQSEEYFIAWMDENGNLVPHLNGDLNSVPNGQYTVTISNKCCDVFTKTYYI